MMPGEMYIETGESRFRFKLQSTVMLFNDLFANRQAQPNSKVALTLFGGDIKLENSTLRFRRDARPGVLDRHPDPSLIQPGFYHQRSGAVHGLYRIGDEVGPHLIQFPRNAGDQR